MSIANGGDTCWSLVGRAAAGDAPARSAFGRTYLPLMRAFLAARWRHSALLRELDDAVQETFVECFRPEGPLARADAARGDFRGFLFGIVRNIALRFEESAHKRRAHAEDAASRLDSLPSQDDQPSRAFDREWAHTLMREAGELMRARADSAAARLRVELLSLRFGCGVSIHDIAAQWEMDAQAVHRAYARARDDFRSCLRHVVSYHAVRSEVDLDSECRRLFELLE